MFLKRHPVRLEIDGHEKYSSSETQGLLAGTMQLIFLGESLLQELKSPWELILTEPVPEVVEFRPADWAEK